ncbi:MAG TPA: hypothetical protein VFC78_19045 [Tepidisphaeraceae bacterium]|nr:hypothetical protein [Tepidisphaeraceae bacterium]
MLKRATGFAGGLLGLAVLIAPVGAATTIYDSNGYEPPTFHTGDLVGQDLTNGPWVQSGNGTAVVQTAVKEGTQAVQVTRQANNDAYFAVVKPVPFVNGTIQVNWDMNVPAATGSQQFGPFFGVSAYDSLDTGTGAPLLIGSAGMDATTGQFLFQDAGTGSIDVGSVLSFGVFHKYQMALNFNTQQYSVTVDGVVQTTQGFVDGSTSSPISSFTDADLSALAASGDASSLAATGSAYYDNYVITQTPEPAMLGLVLPAALGLLLKRRGARRVA